MSDCPSRIGYYEQLGNDSQNLQDLTYKHPRLLLNKNSHVLIHKLSEHITYDNLHEILQNARDENEQTFMFYIAGWTKTDLYRQHIPKLCEQFRARNKRGQTVFDVNPAIALQILLENITFNNQRELMELLTIKDGGGDRSLDRQINWLTHQFKHHNYPLYWKPRILILYNTNVRVGAEKEAQSIREAFETLTNDIRSEEMGTEQDVLQNIRVAAESPNTSVLIVCVMSHGAAGAIEDRTGRLMTLKSIENKMCSVLLSERPKILITQSCQTRGGRKTGSNEGASSTAGINIPYEPGADHFLSCQSCVCGEQSDRNVFIPIIAEQIRNSSRDSNFRDLFTNASREMMNVKNQTPIMKSTLKGKICLNDTFNSTYN